jgi:hypothetical protein
MLEEFYFVPTCKSACQLAAFPTWLIQVYAIEIESLTPKLHFLYLNKRFIHSICMSDVYANHVELI